MLTYNYASKFAQFMANLYQGAIDSYNLLIKFYNLHILESLAILLT